MKIISTSKRGSVTTFKMDWTEVEMEAAEAAGFRFCRENRCEVNNKHEAADFEIYVSSQSAPVVTQSESEAAKAPAKKSRYITSLAVAERDNLNHGAAWVCTERDVETKGANPALEGGLICYVYSN